MSETTRESDEWRCAACHTPATHYTNGICPVCERIHDLRDVLARAGAPRELEAPLRAIAQATSREVWRLVPGRRES